MNSKTQKTRKRILRRNIRRKPKKYNVDEISSDSDSSSSEVSSENSDKYVVEKIVAKEFRWLIKWKGYPSENNTWEPRENLTECEEMLENFENKKRSGERSKDVETSQWESKGQKVQKKDVFVVEKILDKQLWYLIKWEGYPDSDNQWESEDHLLICQDLIDEYENEQNYYKNLALGLAIDNSRGETPRKRGRPRNSRSRDSTSSETRNLSKKNGNKTYVEAVEPHSILGVTEVGGGGHKFLMRWKNNSVGIVPAKAANILWPQLVIAFYEKNLRM